MSTAGEAVPRIARRVAARCELVTTASDKPIVSRCTAISSRGSWVETSAAIDPGDGVIVCFELPRWNKLLTLMGHVSSKCRDRRLLSRHCPPGSSGLAIKFEPLDEAERVAFAEYLGRLPPPLPLNSTRPTCGPSVARGTALLPPALHLEHINRISTPPPPPRRSSAPRPLPPETACERLRRLPPPPRRRTEPPPLLEQVVGAMPVRDEPTGSSPPRRLRPAVVPLAQPPRTSIAPMLVPVFSAPAPARPRRRARRTRLLVACLAVVSTSVAVAGMAAVHRPAHSGVAAGGLGDAAFRRAALVDEPSRFIKPRAIELPFRAPARSQQPEGMPPRFDREAFAAAAAARAEAALRACAATGAPKEVAIVMRVAPPGYVKSLMLTDAAFAYTPQGQCVARKMMAITANAFVSRDTDIRIRVRARE